MDVAVDLVVLAVRHGELNALLIRRADPPFEQRRALPGGFVTDDDEDLLAAARRELREETGIRPGAGHLEQLGAYGARDRDPRGRVIAVAYVALLPDLPEPQAGSDAASARWQPVDTTRQLAFDHDEILRDGVEHVRARLEHTPLATALCNNEFTIHDLRAVYQAVWGTGLDPRNFARKVIHTEGFIRPIRSCRPGPGRPAQLYARGDADILHPPLRRPRAKPLPSAHFVHGRNHG